MGCLTNNIGILFQYDDNNIVIIIIFIVMIIIIITIITITIIVIIIIIITIIVITYYVYNNGWSSEWCHSTYRISIEVVRQAFHSCFWTVSKIPVGAVESRNTNRCETILHGVPFLCTGHSINLIRHWQDIAYEQTVNPQKAPPDNTVPRKSAERWKSYGKPTQYFMECLRETVCSNKWLNSGGSMSTQEAWWGLLSREKPGYLVDSLE